MVCASPFHGRCAPQSASSGRPRLQRSRRSSARPGREGDVVLSCARNYNHQVRAPVERLGRLIERQGPLLAALVSAAAALPGLRFPFLSDDWLLVDSVSSGAPPPTPYDYFRPLYTATYWLDFNLWGARPALFHLTNLVLIAASAALVVVVARRLTGDARLSGWAGILFAAHPAHVENAAWIAVRGDPLFAIFLLMALLSFDRWRKEPRPGRAAVLLAGTLALFELSLLCKESAVILPVLLAALAIVHRERRPHLVEVALGYASLVLVAACHFFVLRPFFMKGPPRSLAPGSWLEWTRQALGFVVASFLPASVDLLLARPVFWGAAALIAAAALFFVVRKRAGRIPPAVWACALVFAVLMGPSIIGFQDRYLFLPVAASGLALAILIRAVGGAPAVALALILGAGWSAAWWAQWANWRQAALASESLVTGLAAASREAGVTEIVVANMPFRVRHGSVAGDFRSALAVSGGRPMPVLAGCFVSYPDHLEDGLDGPPGESVRRSPSGAEVRLHVAPGPYSRLIAPRPAPGTTSPGAQAGSVTATGGGRLAVRIPTDPSGGRALFVWSRGRLDRVF
jgi:hypothetical protein